MRRLQVATELESSSGSRSRAAGFTLANLLGFFLNIAAWEWAHKPHATFASTLLIWVVPLIGYPVFYLGRRFLDRSPDAQRAKWTNFWVHYGMMFALGVGTFAALQRVSDAPGYRFPFSRELSAGLLILTGTLTALSVLNLAIRGMGAPFALKLSSRLATDWMYSCTRNPMVLCTLALLVSAGLWFRSLWFVLWLVLILNPVWMCFVRIYEERELEIRFGESYRRYRARTPFLWPRRPTTTDTRA